MSCTNTEVKLDSCSWRMQDHLSSLEVFWGYWRTSAVMVRSLTQALPTWGKWGQLSRELDEVHCVVHHPEIIRLNNHLCKPSVPYETVPTVAGGTACTGLFRSILPWKWLKNDRHYEMLLIFMKRGKITFTRNCDPVLNEGNMTCLFHSIKRVVKTIY